MSNRLAIVLVARAVLFPRRFMSMGLLTWAAVVWHLQITSEQNLEARFWRWRWYRVVEVHRRWKNLQAMAGSTLMTVSGFRRLRRVSWGVVSQRVSDWSVHDDQDGQNTEKLWMECHGWSWTSHTELALEETCRRRCWTPLCWADCGGNTQVLDSFCLEESFVIWYSWGLVLCVYVASGLIFLFFTASVSLFWEGSVTEKTMLQKHFWMKTAFRLVKLAVAILWNSFNHALYCLILKPNKRRYLWEILLLFGFEVCCKKKIYIWASKKEQFNVQNV